MAERKAVACLFLALLDEDDKKKTWSDKELDQKKRRGRYLFKFSPGTVS